jgi:multicomponent Na+:H+ antiporter subunit G
MALALDIASWALLVAGSAFAVVGGIGLLRLPDFFARIHGGGITDTMGAGLILVGLMLQADHWLPAFKLVMILFFLFLTSPTSAHALSKSALAHGVRPQLAETEEEDGPSPS